MINLFICVLFQKQLAVENGKSKRPQIWTSHAGAIQDMVFNVIQQKIFPLDLDKLFIQETKTK